MAYVSWAGYATEWLCPSPFLPNLIFRLLSQPPKVKVDALMKLMAEVTLPEPVGLHDEPTQPLASAGVRCMQHACSALAHDGSTHSSPALF